MTRLSGIYSALVTPMTDDEELDLDAVQPLVEFELSLGIQGLYVGGSSGEAPLQTNEERTSILKAVAQATRGRTSLIAHVGSVSTRDTLLLAETAQEAGYQAISAVPPYYFDFPRREIIGHYITIAEHANIPLVIYNFPSKVPGFTFNELSELFAHPNIVGIKHTSTDFYLLERMRSAFPDIAIFNGYDEACLSGLAMGADGAIGTTYNIMGDLFVALRVAFMEGDHQTALKLQSLANRIIDVLIAHGPFPATKAALEIMGVSVGPSRKPLNRIGVEAQREIEDALQPLLRWRSHRVKLPSTAAVATS